jgi:hypothetical protein
VTTKPTLKEIILERKRKKKTESSLVPKRAATLEEKKNTLKRNFLIKKNPSLFPRQPSLDLNLDPP